MIWLQTPESRYPGDLLDAMAPEARDLVGRADLVIDQLGVPPGHQVTGLLRRLRVRPGEALATLLNTAPGPLLDAASKLRELAAAYRDDLVEPVQRSLPDLGWAGAGFTGFGAAWAVRAAHISGEHSESMVTKLTGTADFAASAAEWFSQGRHAMAVTLAEAFRSSEAVVLKGCDLLDGDAAGLKAAALERTGRLVNAAANLGAAVLSVIAEWYDAGMDSFVPGSGCPG